MELYFFRHGIALDINDPSVQTDRDRPLTTEGIRKTHAAAEGFAQLGIPVEKILTSPWLRAVQTARILGDVLNMKEDVEEMAELAGDRSVRDVLTGLKRYKNFGRIVLVGHEPLLSGCAGYLMSGERQIHIDLKKAGVCAIDVDLSHSCFHATLLWLATPRQLRLIAGKARS